MEKDFIPYTEALALKELCFDESCFGRYYYKESYPMLNPQSKQTELVFEFGQYLKQTKVTILAPTFSQAFRWFRENYSYHHSVYYHKSSKFECRIADSSDNNLSDDLFNNMYLTYEEAELECLKKLIEIVKNK